MINSFPIRILLGFYVLLLTAGTTYAGDATAVLKQNIDSNGTTILYANTCKDDPQKFALCIKADKPCHCEENRYEMYTYCKRSCGFCTKERMPQRFWRIVNWAPLNRTWYINEIQFFQGKHDKMPLVANDPTKAIASSTYLSFPASNAFDGKFDSAWLPDGWWERQAGGDWIGYDFPEPVDINSVRVVSDLNDTSDIAAKMLVEAGPTAFGPFETRWMIVNHERIADKRFSNPRCPMFWKRFMTDEDAFCYKLVTEYLTWSAARDKCASYGGDLVSINSHEEQAFVQHELLACGFTWLGFNDIQKEQHFTWSDGSNSSFFYWASDEEKDDKMNEMEDCAAMGRDGQWRQFHCEDRFYAFCKKRILTDVDKVVKPNSVSAPIPPVNQTLPEGVPPPPTVLPPGVELPPDITTPPPPPYPYPYPTQYPPHAGTPYPYPYPAPTAPRTPAPGTQPTPQQGTKPTEVAPTALPVVPTAAPGTSPPTPGKPAPGTPPPAPGTPAPGVPLPTPGTPAPGAPPPLPGAVPAPAPAAVPAPVPPAVPAPVPPAVPSPAPAAVPPPAPAAVPPPAPAAIPAPVPATFPVPAPPPAPANHKHRSKKFHDKVSKEDISKEKEHSHKKKVIHSSKIHLKKNKKTKQHHKKAAKKELKNSIKKKDKSLKFHDELDPVGDRKVMDEFLDMVARSNIPKPELFEKELQSNVRKQEIENAEENLLMERQKDKNFRMRPRKDR